MKFLKWLLIVFGILILLIFLVGLPYFRKQTKKFSPERTAVYTKEGLDLEVHYSSPSKKGRTIFGELVPYGSIWRTGANEPTTFTTATAIHVGGEELPAGTYSLWTRPGPELWSVIFNDRIPDWGVKIWTGGKETTRREDRDVLRIEVPVRLLEQPMESFTIDFEKTDELYLTLSWDATKVAVPIKR